MNLESLPNVLSNFPFGLGDTTNENEADNNIFNLFSQLGKHADLLQQIKDEDIEKALERLADQPDTASASASNQQQQQPDEPHVEQLNLFMSSILSKDVMLPACQAVDESYEEWLVKNKDNLSEEEIRRYTNQHQCVKDICKEYETTSNDGQQNSTCFTKISTITIIWRSTERTFIFSGFTWFWSIWWWRTKFIW